MVIKKDYFLYLAILIPIIMIIAVAISVRFYKINFYSQYNFVYAMIDKNNGYCQKQLLNQLFPAEYPNKMPPDKKYDCGNPNFYVYDSRKNTSSPITLNQVTQLKLSQKQSPDGYFIQYYCNTAFSPDWWWDDHPVYGACLRKGDYQKPLKIINNDTNSFFFVGWITNHAGDK